MAGDAGKVIRHLDTMVMYRVYYYLIIAASQEFNIVMLVDQQWACQITFLCTYLAR